MPKELSRNHSLQDYLMWQVKLTPPSSPDKTIAFSIIDAVDKNVTTK
ncbi:MAG: hypothetical protein GPOALKHO_001640 [Sodalis sp.]|nr:MAG: hypothetical protein GPOALKHO_001640 [Sodalis sp.]